MRHLFLFLTLFAGVQITLAQKKSLSISDFASWNRIENRTISHDGKFVAYEVNQQKGDGFLIIYKVATGKSDTIHHGQKPRFSAGSDYLVFNLRVPEDTLRKHKLAKTAKDKMPKESFAVYDLRSANLTKYGQVKSFQMADEKSNWLAFLQEVKAEQKQVTDSAKTNAAKTAKKKESLRLVLQEPIEDKKFIFNEVDSFVVAGKGYQTAFYTKAADSTRIRLLILFNPVNQQTDTIVQEALTIQKLTFDESGNQLAFLGSSDTTAVKNFALYLVDVATKQTVKIVDLHTTGMPAGWSPSVNGNLVFSKDGSKLFFGTAPLPKTVKNDSIPDEDKPKLDVWSYTDNYIQPRQLRMVNQKKRQTYQAVYRIPEKAFVQLADTTIETIRLYNYRNAEVALGIDNQPYQRQTTWSSRYLNDYYLIDLKTGEKKELLKARNTLDLSPNARFALYYNYVDSVYYSIDLSDMTTRALTRGIPVMFCDEENDVPGDPSPYGITGWTPDDRYALIYDRFDIWKIDPTGREAAVNLTGGRENSIRFRYEQLDKETINIPENQAVILNAFNTLTNESGYYRLIINQSAPKRKLLYGDFMTGQIQKAKNADQLIWSTQTVNEFPDVKVSDLDFCFPGKISQANPQQSQFSWPTVERVSWVSFAGDSLRGLLFKPENFDPDRKYPMVVYFYEKSSDTQHLYRYPQPSRSTISIPFYVSNDYLVFVPDIAYGTGYPGRNAYDAIVSGVRKLTETMPFVDPKRIGLQGQSWGGYQIAYLVTQTDMFAAAMAGAPVSNMTSAYGGIRWGTGMSRMFQYEETQSRLGATLWEQPQLYIENSPIFMAPNVKTPLLIMHNDNDGAVPWYQGIELFMALYRLDKPVWLLNYNGMDHNIETKFWANRIDLSTRMFGFFNHYLKGMPAPEWMTRGIQAVVKGDVLGY
jgi:dipeptidyl aminopeptidase/acylaminoacyl peptidase